MLASLSEKNVPEKENQSVFYQINNFDKKRLAFTRLKDSNYVNVINNDPDLPNGCLNKE